MKKQKYPELWQTIFNGESEEYIIYPDGKIEYWDYIQDVWSSTDNLNYIKKELVCEIKPYPIKKKWVPKSNERYYFIWSDGKVMETVNGRFLVDLRRIEIGNCFKTRVEAKEKIREN